MEEYSLETANRLKKLRNILKLSVDKMAEELDTNNYKIRDCENKKQKISNDLLEKIGIVYNVNLNWLITGKGEMFIKENKEINYKEENIEIIKNLSESENKKIYHMIKSIIEK